jgi:thiamine-phosphate pyrophosphorylase
MTIALQMLGKAKIVGLSVSNTLQAKQAEILAVNDIGISPIFDTSTKKWDLAPHLSIEGLKMIRPLFTKPIVCIGGIHKGNVADIIKNGDNGVAIISAISKAKYPENETKLLKENAYRELYQ